MLRAEIERLIRYCERADSRDAANQEQLKVYARELGLMENARDQLARDLLAEQRQNIEDPTHMARACRLQVQNNQFDGIIRFQIGEMNLLRTTIANLQRDINLLEVAFVRFESRRKRCLSCRHEVVIHRPFEFFRFSRLMHPPENRL